MLDIVNLPSVNPTHDIIVGATSVAVTVPTTGATSVVDAHVAAINSLVAKLKQTTGEVEEEIGAHILAIRAAQPNDWEAIVKARCGISRSRAYELAAIADGIKTTEQTRRENFHHPRGRRPLANGPRSGDRRRDREGDRDRLNEQPRASVRPGEHAEKQGGQGWWAPLSTALHRNETVFVKDPAREGQTPC